MVPLLTAYQIEWNKLHHLLQGEQVRTFLNDPLKTNEACGSGCRIGDENR